MCLGEDFTGYGVELIIPGNHLVIRSTRADRSRWGNLPPAEGDEAPGSQEECLEAAVPISQALQFHILRANCFGLRPGPLQFLLPCPTGTLLPFFRAEWKLERK